MTADIVREVFKNADGHTGNPVAKAAARAWLDTIEGLRVRFNAAGGDVGKVDYGWLPEYVGYRQGPQGPRRVRRVHARQGGPLADAA
jgi:hypothetical protein